MRIPTAIVLALFSFGPTGCASMNLASTSYVTEPERNQSRVFIWGSDYSAGIGTQHGICAQGALTATASSAALGAAFSDGTGTIDAEVAAEYAEAVSVLNASSVQTAYANIAYFYLCQIALNSQAKPTGGLSNEQIVTMFNAIGKAAADIKVPATTGVSITSPTSVAVVQEMFRKAGIVKDAEEIREELQEAAAEVEAGETEPATQGADGD